ncbi:MAG: hypothetical protein FJW85_09235 [Actinobacteria bacterium]|nr:hypothetical protein [Actinomycetota bacterium]
MRAVRWMAVVAATVGLMAGTMPPAQAALPDDLEYSYELDTPILGMPSAFSSKGSCTQTLGAAFDLVMNGQPEPNLSPALAKPGNDVRCTLESSADSPGTTISGTVSASSGGQSGTGTFVLVCDIGRSMKSWFNAVVSADGDPALAADPYGVNGAGHVSCSWTIDVQDAQKSQLSGTLEMAGAFSLDSTPVDWSNCASLGLPIPERVLPRAKCVTFDMVISAFVTGGTGLFAGRTGSGTMTQALFIPVVIPIDLSSAPPPDPGCPPEQPDCQTLDLTDCEYSPTNPGDPTWNDLSNLPPNANIPGFKGPGWYRCPGDDNGGGGGGGDGLTGCIYSPTEQTGPGWSFIDPPAGVPGSQGPGWYNCGDGGGGNGGGGGGDGLTRCQFSPTEQTGPGWSYIALPPGASVPGYQGPGWYNCGDVPPPAPTVVVSDAAIEAAFRAALAPRSLGDMLSLSTKTGKASAPRIVAPARVAGSTVRPFAGSTTLRLSTVPGATCAVTAKAGKATAKLPAAKSVNGRVDTKVTATQLMARLKVKAGAQATITANCSVKAGKKTQKLPPTSVTVRFS